MRTHTGSERGAALVIAMLLVVVIGVVTTRLCGTAARAANDSTGRRGQVEARVAAEGGIETARVRLAADPHWTGAEMTIGRSTVHVTAKDAGEGRFEVDATATCPVRGSGLPVRSTVTVQLDRTPAGTVVRSWDER